jgi:NADPH2:quinone reductase
VKAVWYERAGAAPTVLTVGEMPTPDAGPGEVRIRLQASGVNPADVGRRSGNYRAMEFPRVIPNSDGAGIVDQIGEGVTRFAVGDRVWLFNGQRNGRALRHRGRIHHARRLSGDAVCRRTYRSRPAPRLAFPA